MGRTPKSSSEKRLTGAGKRVVRALATAPLDAEQAIASDFPPPAWLVDKTAIGVWHRMAPELRRLNLLAASDRDIFGRYCFHFAGFIRASEQAPVGREFTLVKMTGSEERMPRLHPAVKARELHERHLIDIEDRFGGSPLARFRLIAQQAAHPGAWGDLFNRSGKPSDPDAPAETAPATSPIGALAQPTAH